MQEMDIECFYSQEHLKILTDIIDHFQHNELVKVDQNNMKNIIDFQNGCQDTC